MIDTASIDRVFHMIGNIGLFMSGVTIMSGAVNGAGGGIFSAFSTLQLTDVRIIGNTSLGSGDGGGIYSAGFVTLSGVTLSNNTATGTGGGMTVGSGTVQISDSSITGNIARSAGGIANLSGSLTISDSTVTGNRAIGPNGAGGGIFSVGLGAVLSVIRTEIRQNDAQGLAGGGIFAGGTVTVKDSTISNNSADFAGGRISGGSTLTVTNSLFTGNTAGGSGGGISAAVLTTISNTTISTNSAGFAGGGISTSGCSGDLTVSRSTINGNTTGSDGGGINSCTTTTVTNSTISGNFAGGVGGGLSFGVAGGVFTLRSVTVTANNVPIGGLNASSGATTVQNSIIAFHAMPDCGGVLPTSLGNNLDADTSCQFSAPTDVSSADPRLAPLAANGGLTSTHALLAGSPAINTGDPFTAPPADQRGFPRVGLPDIGAFEFQTNTDQDGDGFVAPGFGGDDCDDTDPAAFPGAPETPYDAIDQNCDGDPLDDVDGDGVAAGQALGGAPDCDDTDPAVFPGAIEVPGDGIDQNCDGADAAALVARTLVAGWNTLVFAGQDQTNPADFAARIGPRLDSLWGYGAALQTWLVFRPGGLALLSTLGPLQTGQALFLLIAPGSSIRVDLPDLLPAGPITVTLLPEWNFLGFTGATGTGILDALAPAVPGVDVAFRFGADTQTWGGFFVAGPGFLNAFTTLDRLSAVFVFNAAAALLSGDWDQIAAPP